MVELSDGLGLDVVFECAAAKSTFDDAIQMVRRSGQVMLVAITWKPTELLSPDWMAREVGLSSIVRRPP